jgi:Concanavalin A-like lectin/glucanases superfamily/Pectate lyase superfamily protein/K319L-like, PKD domain
MHKPKKIRSINRWRATAILLGCFVSTAFAQEEFVGPFPSWANAKSAYGARGDGSADDTAALQNALNDLGATGKADVLYLPAGTYRITSTLILKYKSGVSIIGQDPSNTIIRWAGGSGGTMMLANGVTESRWGRITWDGSGAAGAAVAHQWDQAGGYAPSNLEHADEVFQNVGKGIIGGRFGGANDAEVTIIRSKFTKCSVAGVSIESYNALDYWIWNSQFINNARGVTSEFGAGNYMVYGSFFQNSSIADLNIGQTQFFSFRNNTSIGSAQFLRAINIGQNVAPTTVQGNKILDTTNPIAIDVANVGSLMLLDNQIRSANGASGPAVRISTWALGGDLLSVGNTYTVSNPIAVQTSSARWWSQDDQVVSYSQVNGSLPSMPGPLPNLNRQVFEVAAGGGGNAIQQAINQAAQLAGQRPIVHLPKGTYQVGQTLTVPTGADVQIVGDGHGTGVNWSGTSGGIVFQLNGPSKATFRELTINAGNANAIEVGNPDQPGSRLHIEGAMGAWATGNNILTENLVNTIIDCQGCEYWHVSGSNIKAVGAAGAGSSRIAFFGSMMGANSVTSDPLYEVTNGGRILVEDSWFEGSNSRVIYPRDSGVFSYNGGQIAPTTNSPLEPVIDVSGFNGLITLLGVRYDTFGQSQRTTRVSSETSNTNVFLGGLEFNLPNSFVRSSSGGTLNFLNNKVLGSSGSQQLPDSGDARTAAFVRSMLNQIRTVQPSLPTSLASGITDVRMFRVRILSAIVGIHLKSTAQQVQPQGQQTQSNQPPAVNAGSAQTITLPSSATLNGTGTDDGLPFGTLTVSWSQVSGPGVVTFANPASLTTTASFSVAGSYVLKLTASDGALTSSATVSITTVQAATSSSSTPPPTPSGLVAGYAFNEGSGVTVADASGNGHSGAITGATWTTAGRFGSALVFNGRNAVVTIADSPSLQLTTGMTLEAWVQPSVVNTTWRDVVYKGDDNYALEATSSTGVAAPGGVSTIGGANLVTLGTSPLAVGAWAHLALTYDGSTLRLYVNGTPVSTLPRSGSMATSSNPLQIGGDSIFGQFFSGVIDEVRVYNVALSAAQIQSDMNSPL